MTDGEPQTRGEFEATVQELVAAADRNGVAPAGGIDVRTDDGCWTVEITDVEPE